MNCPFMSPGLKTVALTVLNEASSTHMRRTENGSHLKSGTVLRAEGRYDAGDSDQDIEPVLFLVCPYILRHAYHAPSLPESGKNLGITSLLQSHYGYDVGSNRENNQVVRKLFPSSDKRVLHTPQLWCLIIGSGETSSPFQEKTAC